MTTTVYLRPEDMARLRIVAAELGLTRRRGAGTGQVGAISNLLRAIAAGEVEVRPAVGEPAEKKGEE